MSWDTAAVPTACFPESRPELKDHIRKGEQEKNLEFRLTAPSGRQARAPSVLGGL